MAYYYPRYALKLLRLITNKEFISRLADLQEMTDAAFYRVKGDVTDAADLLMLGIENVNEGCIRKRQWLS